MVRCAQLYYNQDRELSQAEVADKLEINPTKVSRLLREAQSEGIVRVEIIPPRLQRLELELMDAFGLRDAVVVPSGDVGAYEAIGQAAAEYFTRIAQDNISVGLGPGFTIQKMIEYLRALPFTGHRLYPLSSESTSVISHFYPSQLANLMMTKYKDVGRVSAYAYRIPTRPADEHDLPAYRAFMDFLFKDQAFTRLMDQARAADIMILGVGAADHPGPALSAFFKSYHLDPVELMNRGVVGMINYQFLDAEGRLLTAKEIPDLGIIEASLVRISLDDVKKAARTFGRSIIGIAGGSFKTKALRAALRGGYINVIITDVNVAEKLLNGE